MKAKRIFSGIFFAICIAVTVFILIRIFVLNDNDALTALYPTDNAISAYVEGKEFTSHDSFESIADDGYYSANGMVYCEATGELQLTGRYNDSLYTYLNCSEDTEFTWKLVDMSDETEYKGKVVASEEKYIYNYRRVVFENVDITEESELYLYLCYEDKYPVEDETKGLLVHIPGETWKAYKLSDEEAANLGK